ncbi:hypothetical protein C8R31_102647 [Nitrosospira sp. Nsp2]|nr:hypothetical protein C8R31_102647 [Nitrosospira sp. Nsp2]
MAQALRLSRASQSFSSSRPAGNNVFIQSGYAPNRVALILNEFISLFYDKAQLYPPSHHIVIPVVTVTNAAGEGLNPGCSNRIYRPLRRPL